MPDEISATSAVAHLPSVITPDPYGEAALLLAESLMHDLIARSLLSIEGALEVVQIAIDSRLEIGDGRGEDPRVEPRTAGLLRAIRNSLGTECSSA